MLGANLGLLLYGEISRCIQVSVVAHGPLVLVCIYTTRRFMFGLAQLFVYMFFCPFSILITLLGKEEAGLCAYRAFVC